MEDNKPAPGVSRQHRLSDEGLARLEKQLRSGMNINPRVLSQWIKRYGDRAREIIRKYRPQQTGLD